MSSKLLPACLALLIQQALDWDSPSSLGSGWLSYYMDGSLSGFMKLHTAPA